MLDHSHKQDTRELRRRALRWQRHRLPRKSGMNAAQRMAAGLILATLAALIIALATLPGAQAITQMPIGDWPDTPYRWANVNAYAVNFRQYPSTDAPVVAQYSWGTCVEVVSVWDGWAEVLHHNHLHTGALYVWAEYLDIVNH